MRTQSKDDAIILAPVMKMTLEKAIEYIKEDEIVEVTPKHIRLRKKVLEEKYRKMKKKSLYYNKFNKN